MRRPLRPIAMLVLAAAAAAAAAWSYVWRQPPRHPASGAWTAVVSTIAGSGLPGFRDGDAARAAFSDPFGVAASADGSVVYVADAGDNNRIRRIDANGVTTVAGDSEGFRDGLRSEAAFHTPSAIAIDRSGRLYVADTGNHAIRRVDPNGSVTTVAGSGRPGYRDGPAAGAMFNGPVGLAIADDGAIYVADTYNDRIRRISPDGIVTTVAGAGTPGYADGAASSAQFDTPCGIAIDSRGALIVADTNNHVLRRVDLERATVSTILPIPMGSDDVSLFRPIGVAVARDDAMVAADRRGRLVQVMPDGFARVLAGSRPDFGDGIGTAAGFFNPTGLAVDPEGALLVADAGNYLVRRVAPIALYPPDPPRSPLAPSPAAAASQLVPYPLPWPLLPQLDWHEVTGTMGEPRGTAGGDGRDRFHAGIDIRGDEGEPVLAVRTAKVDSPVAAQGYGTLNESLSVGAVTYVHLRVGRDRYDTAIDPDVFIPVTDETGEIARIRVRRGTRIRFGQMLGTVNRFHHVHLNTGPAGRELNPLLLQPPGFVDSVPPKIAPNGIVLTDEWSRPFPTPRRGRPVPVSGRVRIVVEAWDGADGNAASRRLGLYRFAYQLLHPDGRPAASFENPLTTLLFDRLPRDPEAARLVYADGSGIAGQGRRRTRYRYLVTNRLRAGVASEDFWDTRLLAPGDYVLRIIAADAAGNETVSDVPVRVENDGTEEAD
ncbi:MAG TPA: SMP-30/gluconolactonase/LRE family protein [Vicinamibacterales bacterium]|nr:SMP-30/gluconolactonase/LRE family protein [Vicinamibacterales bacterium]